MMTQEEYVDGVLALKRQGKTITEIAEELGYHPATISSRCVTAVLRRPHDRPGAAGDRRAVGGADPPVGAAAGGEVAGVFGVLDHPR